MTRWRVEFGLAATFAVLAALTSVVPDWIEAVFNVDPDGGNGSLEWALVAIFAALAVVAAALGRRSYLKAAETG